MGDTNLIFESDFRFTKAILLLVGLLAGAVAQAKAPSRDALCEAALSLGVHRLGVTGAAAADSRSLSGPARSPGDLVTSSSREAQAELADFLDTNFGDHREPTEAAARARRLLPLRTYVATESGSQREQGKSLLEMELIQRGRNSEIGPLGDSEGPVNVYGFVLTGENEISAFMDDLNLSTGGEPRRLLPRVSAAHVYSAFGALAGILVAVAGPLDMGWPVSPSVKAGLVLSLPALVVYGKGYFLSLLKRKIYGEEPLDVLRRGFKAARRDVNAWTHIHFVGSARADLLEEKLRNGWRHTPDAVGGRASTAARPVPVEASEAAPRADVAVDFLVRAKETSPGEFEPQLVFFLRHSPKSYQASSRLP